MLVIYNIILENLFMREKLNKNKTLHIRKFKVVRVLYIKIVYNKYIIQRCASFKTI